MKAEVSKFGKFTLYSDFPVVASSFPDFLEKAVSSLLSSGSLFYDGHPVYPSCIDQCSGNCLSPKDRLNVNGTLYKIYNLNSGVEIRK